MTDYEARRRRMVEQQLQRRGISDPFVLDAMREVPREAFVSDDMAEFAYEDSPLPIEDKQTISQPYIVAMMIEAAEIQPGDRVLEVGAGSGYAAAVIGRIAGEVHAVERQERLAELARQRLRRLGYDQVHVHVGDGTKGYSAAAPFDAILVAAGGPHIPHSLRLQLALGGRLVMPVGDRPQTLTKLIRTGEDAFQQEDLGAVTFVPLIGEEGWVENGSRSADNQRPAAPGQRSLSDLVANAAEPLPDFDDPAFGKMFDRWADKRVVLLGEASHGTHEFYAARAAITRHLIEHHGFSFVAVEADWPDAAQIDRYVRRRPPGPDDGPPFERFPSWMWRNTDIADLTAWMRTHNDGLDMDRRAGFYGLDMYNMRGSISAVLDYLDQVDHEAAAIARERYGCLTPWQNDPAVYGRAVLTEQYRKCEQAVVEQCRAILEKRLDYEGQDGEGFLDAAQNARLIASAERYYRIMYYGGAESWNLRDSHMFETLDNLLTSKGPEAKAIVWAHNSHIGDARATVMGSVRGEHNIGQLCRERWKDEVALLGFGTHTGTVAAATDWDGDMEIKAVRPSRHDSYERVCHDSGQPRFLLDLGEERHEALRTRLNEPRLERFIGVIYRPETERQSHYSRAILPQQFDAYVWFDETRAITPLEPEHHPNGIPDTYPFGL